MTPPRFEILGENQRLPSDTQTQLTTLANTLTPHTSIPEVSAFFSAAQTGDTGQLFDALRVLQLSRNTALAPAQDSIRSAAMSTGHFLDQLTVAVERGIQVAAAPLSGVGTSVDQAARNIGLPSPSDGVNVGMRVYQELPGAFKLPVLGGIIGGATWLLSWPVQMFSSDWGRRMRTIGSKAWEYSWYLMYGKIIGDFFQRGFVGGLNALVPPIARPYTDRVVNFFRGSPQQPQTPVPPVPPLTPVPPR